MRQPRCEKAAEPPADPQPAKRLKRCLGSNAGVLSGTHKQVKKGTAYCGAFPLAKTIKRLDYLPKLLLLLTISNAMPTAAQATAIAGHKMTVAVSPVWGVLEPASETALSSS